MAIKQTSYQTDKQRYYYLLTQLWSEQEKTRVWAIYQLIEFGPEAVGPITRRLADKSDYVAEVAYKILSHLECADGVGYFLACRDQGDLFDFFDFGAYLTNTLSDTEGVYLQQAAILAGFSGLSYYVPNLCHAWVRNKHHFASRALIEALYRLKNPSLIPTFRHLSRHPDGFVRGLAKRALAEMEDRAGIQEIQAETDEAGPVENREDMVLYGQLDAWMQATKPFPAWSHPHRWPSHADRLVQFLNPPSETELLEWDSDDLPTLMEYGRRIDESESKLESVELWCDGSFHDSSSSGWGAISVARGVQFGWYGRTVAANSTDAELQAALGGLRQLRPNLAVPASIIIRSDSSVLVEGMNYRVNRWRRRGWLNSQGDVVGGLGLWIELLELTSELTREGHDVRWRWIPGHSGVAMNERAHALSQQGARADAGEVMSWC